jgi:putative chitinase
MEYLNYLNHIAGHNANSPNVFSVANALDQYAARFGLDLPHRFAQFAAQVGHESGRFKYDREVWGPTPAQAGYDTRTDLGNTPERDGDGKKNAGRGPIQLTGAYNIKRFEDWCVSEFGREAVPDFSGNPDLINTDPWEGLSAIWYWAKGNPEGKSLNHYADEGNNEMITRRINGGLNGLADRLNLYTKIGLRILGFNNLTEFQTQAQKNGTYSDDVDGIDGPKTRSAIHQELVKMGRRTGHVVPETKSAPVTEIEPVMPQGADRTAMTRTFGAAGILSPLVAFFTDLPDYAKVALVGISIVAVIVLVWKAELIAARVRAALKAFGLGA